MAISSGKTLATNKTATQPLKPSKGGLASAQKKASGALDSSAGLESFAISKGLEPPKPSKFRSALDAVGRVLNVGTAVSAGLVRGAIRPDMSVVEGVKEGVQKNIGFGDVIREDLGIKPKTRLGKVAVGTISLVADIALDPITYMTFGTGSGAKIGGRVLSKEGQKILTTIARQSGGKVGLANELVQQLAGKGAKARMAQGLEAFTEEAFQKAAAAGVSRETLERVSKFAPDVFDKGGIKIFGKTLVSGERIRNLPGIKQVGDALAGSERVQDVKNTLGDLFVFNFGKDEKLQSLLSSVPRKGMDAAQGLVKRTEDVFLKRGLNNDEMLEVFDTLFKKKQEVLRLQKEFAAQGVEGARQVAKATQRGQKLLSENPKVQAVLDDLTREGGLIDELAKIAKIKPEDAFEFYVPSIITKEGKKEYLVGGGKTLSSPDLGFKKEFRGATEGLETDPFKAFSIGQVKAVNARIQGDAIKKVGKTWGRAFDSDETAKALGYVPFSRKTIDGEVKTYLPEGIAKELNAFLSPTLKPIDRLAKVSGFDWYTRLWKGYVTSIFPAFHIRNVTSNGFLNMTKFGMSAFNPKTGKLALDAALGRNLTSEIMARTGKRYSLGEIVKLAKQQGIVDSGAFSKAELLLEEGSQRIAIKGGLKQNVLKRVAKTVGKQLTPEGKAFQVGRQVGETAENQAKFVGFLTSLMEGKTPKQAAKEVEQAVFNYSKLTTFEKSIMRRLIPFYSFTRFNAEAQIRGLLKTPGRTAGQLDFIKNLSGAVGEPITEQDMEGIPPYELSRLGIKWGTDKDGNPRFITGFGLPIEAFLEDFSGQNNMMKDLVLNALNKANPTIKTPLEAATGQDFFRERPIAELYDAKDLVAVLDAMPKGAADELKELLEWSEQKGVPVYENDQIVGYKTKYTANPEALHFIRSLPTSRILSTISQVASQDATAAEKALRLGTGVKVSKPDIEQQKFFKELDRKKQLTSWLVRLGFLGEFKQAYQKKNVEVDAANANTEE